MQNTLWWLYVTIFNFIKFYIICLGSWFSFFLSYSLIRYFHVCEYTTHNLWLMVTIYYHIVYAYYFLFNFFLSNGSPKLLIICYSLNQESENIFNKESDSKYFLLCECSDFCCVYSTVLSWHISSHGQYTNIRVCPALAHGLYFDNILTIFWQYLLQMVWYCSDHPLGVPLWTCARHPFKYTYKLG